MVFNEYEVYLENQLPVLVKLKEYDLSKRKLENPKDMKEFFCDELKLNKLAEERLYMLATNQRNKPIGLFMISKGTNNCSVFSPREILIRLSLVGATNFFIIHNHPSEDVSLSKDDLATYKRLKEVGKITNFNLLDFIIIGGNDFYSALENKL